MSIETLIGVKTDFSLGESALPSEAVADIAKRLGMQHVCVADTMNLNSMIDVGKKCQKLDIQAHVGVNLRIVDDLTLRGAEGKAQNKNAYYLKAWAKNDAGVKELGIEF